MTRVIRSAVEEVDSAVAASGARTLGAVWRASLGSRRANVRLLEVFGNVAAVLCAIGVYGVAAFATRARRRELAIRAALGADRRHLLMTMIRSEWSAVVAGLGLGVLLALLLAPALFGDAFDVNPRDLSTVVAVVATLAVVAGLASYLPIRTAGSADPTEALRG